MGSIFYTSDFLQPREVVDCANEAVNEASEELRRINLEIYQNPEIRFEETKACKLLVGFLRGRGWEVQVGVYGLKTAFEARFSVIPGGRTICFNAEYDALPGLGHACGHNLIATSAIAGALAASTVLRRFRIPGTIVVMGTPAEESGGGKWIMAKHGAWKGFDACVQTHAMNDYATPMCVTRASWKLEARFYGKPAHAASAPWNGRNACDAIVQAYTAIGLLRQQISKTESIQGVILEAGKASNIIPGYAAGSFSIRAMNSQDLEALKVRFEPVFTAAADSTGCRVELDWTALYEDVITNWTLAEQYRQYMLQYLGSSPEEMIPLEESIVRHDQPGSTDFGTCSHICPGIHPVFNIKAPEPPHTKGFLEAAATTLAHEEALRAGKANALICLDVLSNDDFAAKIRAEFEKAMSQAGRSME